MREKFANILDKYLSNETVVNKDNEIYKELTKYIPSKISSLIGDGYKIKGSMGQGNKASVPWIAIMDERMTKSTQKGLYMVYLFKEDMSGFYLTLNQGITYFSNEFGNRNSNNKAALISNYFKRQLPINTFSTNEITIGAGSKAEGYAATTILSKYYSKDNIPSDEILKDDILLLNEIYQELADLIAESSYEDVISDILINDSTPLKELVYKEETKKFTWVPFFKELANKILEYKDNRDVIIEHLSDAFDSLGIKNPLVYKNENKIVDIDPFTVFAIINRTPFKEKSRLAILAALKNSLGITADAPHDLEGIPTRNSQKVWFAGSEVIKNKTGNKNIDNLWKLFETGIKLADGNNISTDEFNTIFLNCFNSKNVSWGATYGLFWIRPEYFVGLDKTNRDFILSTGIITNDMINNISKVNGEYLHICDLVKNNLRNLSPSFNELYDLSAYAWKNKKAEDDDEEQESEELEIMQNLEKNIILYGPPGTGKTYITKVYAISICDGINLNDVMKMDYNTEIIPRYNTLVSEGRILFTTFHQSYGYEEFIEGIKAITTNGNVSYEVTDGVFKLLCGKAGKPAVISKELNIASDASIWKYILKDGSMNEIKQDCFNNNHIRLGWDINSEFGVKWAEGLSCGDIVLIFKSKSSIDAIGIIEEDGYTELDTEDYKYAKKVKWLVKGIDVNIIDINGGKQLSRTTYNKLPNMKMQSIIELIKKYNPIMSDIEVEETVPYVFIIDEINRGNISKIFGELITLIEDSKRGGSVEETSVTLPYSGDTFVVPNNLFILGTMNTADRSIALMDTALRRRFQFIEMMPNSEVIEKLNANQVISNNKELDVSMMLDIINQRIEVLFDREHAIGHPGPSIR